jgi:hypothetical protein
MKRINVKINDVITWSAYKSNAEYQAWIDSCIAANSWGLPGSYVVEVLDADVEYEQLRQSRQLATKQFANEIDARVITLEGIGPYAHAVDTANPHATTKAQVGLGSVDDVSAASLRDRSTHTGSEAQLTWSEGATITTPVAGLTTYAKNIGGRQMFAQRGKSGVDYSFQPFIARNAVFSYKANGNATTSTVFGGVAPTAGGTATTRNVATTSFFTWIRRVGQVSATTGNASSGLRHSQLQYGTGNGANRGGFHFVARFGISDATLVPGARLFVGMVGGTGVIGNSEPSALTNIIGVGMDAADTTLQIMHNDATGAATKINLGASFPESTNTDFYELVLYCAPNDTSVLYQVSNLTTGAEASGEITTNLPLNTQLLAWQLWRHNVSTGVAVGIDIASVYIETDN